MRYKYSEVLALGAPEQFQGFSRVGLLLADRVGSDRVESGRVGSGLVGSGRVGRTTRFSYQALHGTLCGKPKNAIKTITMWGDINRPLMV